MNPYLSHPLHPLRPVNYRWRLASYLEERQDQPFCRHVDPYLTIARRFVRLLKTANGDEWRLAKMTHMHAAYEIFDRFPIARNRIEARVLANEATESIALKNGTTAELILLYERVFFDVRHRLGNPDYILNEALGVPPLDGMGGWTYAQVWKYFAYFGGSCVLDEIMNMALSDNKPKTVEEVAAYLSKDAQVTLSRHVVLAARALEPRNPRTSMALMQMNARLEAARKRSGESDHLPDITKNIDAMVKSLGPIIRIHAESDPDDPNDPMANGGAELRAHEKLADGMGFKVPFLEEMKAMKSGAPEAGHPGGQTT